MHINPKTGKVQLLPSDVAAVKQLSQLAGSIEFHFSANSPSSDPVLSALAKDVVKSSSELMSAMSKVIADRDAKRTARKSQKV